MGIKDEVRDAWDGVLSPLFDEFAAEVTVEVLDAENTVVDELYGEEEEEKVYRDPIPLKARVKIEKDRVVLPGGETKDIDGRATFKTEDLNAQAVELDFGTVFRFKGEKYTVIHIQESSGVGEDFLLTRVLLKEES